MLEGVDDVVLGFRMQVNSTPTFFIRADGRTEHVEATLTYADIQPHVDASLPSGFVSDLCA